MRCLFDVNVLIASLDPSHTQHAAAHSWISAQPTLRWASCPLTENGLIRIMSQPAYAGRAAPVAAVARLRRTIADTDHEFWPDDISILAEDVIDWPRLIGHRQITDAYLLALAVRRGGRLVTFDRSVPLSVVVGASEAHVVVLEA